jgi:hypothetical protein
MSAWLSKWGPLAGTVSALLLIVSLVTGDNTPGDNATAAQVIKFYTDNHTHRTITDYLIGLTMLFLVMFAVTLPVHVRRGERWIATGAIAGAVWTAIGFVVLSGFDLVLAIDYKDLTPASAQTLNLLENDFALPVVIGFGLFGILAGLAVVAGRIWPAWPWSPGGSGRPGWDGCCSPSGSCAWSRRSPGSRSSEPCCGS